FWQISIDDITKLIENESMLKEERDRAQTYLDVAGVVILLIGSDGKVRLINRRGAAILGYTEEEIVGKDWFEHFIPEHIRQKLRGLFKSLLEKGADLPDSPDYVENAVLTKSGEERLIAWRNTVIKDGTGRITATLSSGEDITEKRRSEENLKESEEKFRNLSEESPNMIFINRGGKVVYANKKCEDIMGYSKEEFYGPNFDFMNLIVPEYREIVKTNYQKHLAGQNIDAYEYALITKSGKRIETIITTKLIRYDNQKAVLGIVTDISRWKHAEEALGYRYKFEELIASISSEFINLQPEEMDTAIDVALEMIGEFAGVDRSYLFLFHEERKMMTNINEWCREGITPHKDRLRDLPVSGFPWILRGIMNGDAVPVPLVDKLPPEAAAEKREFEHEGIKSLVCVPMIYRGDVIGFLGFDAVTETKEWTEETIS
ncbi:MAG TPA: PAS domain S-box protein, partial [bacterium]|nr:PAS domain S-box protein [bacterium]